MTKAEKAAAKLALLNNTAPIAPIVADAAIVADVAKVDEVAEVVEVEYVTLTLPKGTKVTASKRTIIAPASVITAGKERWFEVKRLKSYKVEGGLVTITINKNALGYRQMLTDEA